MHSATDKRLPMANGAGNAPPQASVLHRLDVPEIDVVSCHTYAEEEGLLAVCPNSEDIVIFKLDGDMFRQLHVLAKHTQRVTGLAWSSNIEGHRHRRLASCSEDRTAFVWDFDEDAGQWVFVPVELKAPRAALCVSWAPNGQRFAVGLASRDVAVCYYRPEVRSFVAMKVGKSKASVGAIAWHPTSQFLATGSTDYYCMVYDVNEEHMLPHPQAPFGEAQVSEDAGAWVNSVMFSPTGRYLGFLPHDSTVRIKDLSGGPNATVLIIRWKGLPFLRGAFLSDKCLVACGFDFVPVVFRCCGGQWSVSGVVDPRPTVTMSSSVAPHDSFAEMRSKFRGGSNAASAVAAGALDAVRSRQHTNTITACFALGGAAGCERFSTSAADGHVLIWQLG